jgi:hypothetical protein
MRTVFTNGECVRTWFKQNQQRGRSGNWNLSFDGDTLYSYSAPIAKIVGKIVLVTSENYSVTTGQHRGLVWSNDFTRCDVPSLAPDHAENVQYFLDRMKETVLKWSNENTRGRWWLAANHRWFEQLTEYCQIFSLKMPITLGLYLDPSYEFVKKRIWKTPEGREIVVPTKIADKAKSEKGLEPKDILKTRNAETRREIVRRVGIERICYSLNAECIDRKGLTLFSTDVPEHYELLLLDLGDGRRRPFLKMLNPSVPECWHIEGVHPACKTVQDALNYRRYGNAIIERHRSYFDHEQDHWVFPPDTIRENVQDWKPETVT